MIKTMKQGALALALLSSIGPSGGPERYDYKRHHTFRPYYYGGLDPYGYARYYYGPGIPLWGPGVVIGY